MNQKRVYRLYREEGLSMRVKRPRRHVSAAYREGRVQPGRANEWLAYRVSVESIFCSKSATFGSTAGSPLANPAVI